VGSLINVTSRGSFLNADTPAKGVKLARRNTAEFETNIRKERQLEGIAKAKAAGVYKGRPPSIDAEKVKAMHAEGMGGTEIARAMGIGRASVYRMLGK
jgi:DNA invertase Pin-like site-specific DNA recombinase